MRGPRPGPAAALTLLLLLGAPPGALPALRAPAAPRPGTRGPSSTTRTAYSVPVPRVLALSPRGLRVSIPDNPGIALVRFHLGVNRPLSAQRLGSINVEVAQPTGSAWAYEDRTTVLGAGDLLYYWLQISRAGLSYERSGSHTVEDFVETYDVGTPASTSGADPALKRRLPVLPASPPGPPAPQQQQSCHRSRTSVNGRLVCRGELLFLEHFDGPEVGVGMWVHDVRIAGQPDHEFTAFTTSAANTYAVNGQLVVRPTLTDDVFGEDFVRTGRLELDNCTAGAASSLQCTRQARYGFILPPTLSGRISTRKSFSFRYGVLEIRAKLPSGDWIYPELWLLPREEAYGPGLASGRVQMAMARGNAELRLGATELGLRRLEASAVATSSPPTSDLDGPGLDDDAVDVPAATARTTAATTMATPFTDALGVGSVQPVALSGPTRTSTASTVSRATASAPARTRNPTRTTPSMDTTRTTRYYPAGTTAVGSRPGVTPSQPGRAPAVNGRVVGARWPEGAVPRGRRSASRTTRAEADVKEVSRTELPGRSWASGFHNYTLRWTPDAMVFSVDGVELGTLRPEQSGGFFKYPSEGSGSARSPWSQGSKMAPFDREFYISLGLAVGGIHAFPDGVQGPQGSAKPWKNTAAKAVLSFWNAKNQWYRSWTTDSALLVDFVRVTAL